MGMDRLFFSIYDKWHIDDRRATSSKNHNLNWIFAVLPLQNSDAQSQKI
jgi:hypothetical protein